MVNFYLINKKNNTQIEIGTSNGFGTFWTTEHFTLFMQINKEDNNFIIKSSTNNEYTINEFYELLSQHINIILQ